ncbi:MAG: hypothetical protein H6711_04620 [Myxococcales bacterium]|nr:hypothetical protein [Myxococcales bacterium]
MAPKLPLADDSARPPTAIAVIEARLAALDPDIVQASYEIDLSLLRWSLSLTPLERLRSCTRSARALARLRRADHDPATADRG